MTPKTSTMFCRGRNRNLRLAGLCLGFVVSIVFFRAWRDQAALDLDYEAEDKDYEEFVRVVNRIQRKDNYGKSLVARDIPDDFNHASRNQIPIVDSAKTPNDSNQAYVLRNNSLQKNENQDAFGEFNSRDKRTCREKRNFVYLKEIKCASTTLTGMFRRFGYVRRLQFVLPVKRKIYLGWPYQMESGYYRPSLKGREFNILCEHAVFDEERMRAIMPRDTVYITSLREPFSQVKSMFNYYNFPGILKISTDNQFETYLKNITEYEKLYKSREFSPKRWCIPDGFSMTYNLMSYILGFPTGFLPEKPDKSSDPEFIRTWINSIDETLDHVIITEYFHESLIVLKRKMCWNFKDILYLTKNVGQYSYREYQDPKLVAMYKKWSNVDYEVYDHFNGTLWRYIAQQGDDFWEEVRDFKDLLRDVGEACRDFLQEAMANVVVYDVAGSRWSGPFTVDFPFCTQLNEDGDLLSAMQTEYHMANPGETEQEPAVKFC